MMCCSGVCQPYCGPVAIDGCAITSPGGPIESDGRRDLDSVAWRGDPATGAQIVARAEFHWRSSDPSVVFVDEVSGRATGGALVGLAEITASAGGKECGRVALANNLPAASATVRVLVYDAGSGTAVPGAVVVSVSVEVTVPPPGVTEGGEKTQEESGGRLEQESTMAVAKGGGTGVSVRVAVAYWPALIVAELGFATMV